MHCNEGGAALLHLRIKVNSVIERTTDDEMTTIASARKTSIANNASSLYVHASDAADRGFELLFKPRSMNQYNISRIDGLKYINYAFIYLWMGTPLT